VADARVRGVAPRCSAEQERIHSPVDVYVSCFAEEKRIAALVADPPVAEQWNPYADGDVVHSPPREGRREAPVGTPQFPSPLGGPD